MRSGWSRIVHPRDSEAQHPGERLELIKLATMLTALVRGRCRLSRSRLGSDLLQHSEVPTGEDGQERDSVSRGQSADRPGAGGVDEAARSRRTLAAARSPNWPSGSPVASRTIIDVPIGVTDPRRTPACEISNTGPPTLHGT